MELPPLIIYLFFPIAFLISSSMALASFFISYIYSAGGVQRCNATSTECWEGDSLLHFSRICITLNLNSLLYLKQILFFLQVRGYTFNINSGAVESLELDSLGISIIPSTLVRMNFLLCSYFLTSSYLSFQSVVCCVLDT